MSATKHSEGTALISFRLGRSDTGLSHEVARRVDGRHSRNEVARRDLERYYAVLRRSLPTFDRQEALAILDATNGTAFDPTTVGLLWADVDDAEGLGEKWGIDRHALVARLRGLTYAESMALVDAAERFWSYGKDADTDLALEASGLV